MILGAVLWQPIGQFLLNRLNYSGVFATGPQTQGNLDLFNPIGVAYNPVDWALGWLNPTGSQIVPAPASMFLGALAVVLWILVPMLGAYLLFVRRD